MVIQETCARVGAATGRGVLDLGREVCGLGVVAVCGWGCGHCQRRACAAADLLGISPLPGGAPDRRPYLLRRKRNLRPAERGGAGFPAGTGLALDLHRPHRFCGGCGLNPRSAVIDLLVRLQVPNGLLLPVVLFFVLRLANNPKPMGRLKNNRTENAVG